MSLDELINGSGGEALSRLATEFVGVGTDTRSDLANKIFVALKGDTFDAHDFLPKAVAAGATALLVDRVPENAVELLQKVTIVKVDDTLKAFQNLGKFWRHKMSARVVAVTGTNGKTTTKEFAAAIIGSRFNVQYSKGSFNNHWGVPMSLLSITPDHEVAVIEMGMNHQGELQELSKIVDADVVLCTMVGRGHLEGVSSIENVARAKAEIYEFAPKSSAKIFNLENPYTAKMFETWGRNLPSSHVLTFAGREWASNKGLTWPGLDVAFDVTRSNDTEIHISGNIQGVDGETTVPVFGRHNVTNLMAAACFAISCGMTPDEIWRALPLCKNAWGRNQWVELENGGRVLFDAYNANPESMRAAIDNFAGLKAQAGGRKFVVLGEMRELGQQTPDLHRELGSIVGAAGFDSVGFVGLSGSHFAAGLTAGGFQKTPFLSLSYEQGLALKMLPVLNESDLVLIKGSRGMELEKVLAELKPIGFAKK
jgi:UDP-N-acetylmuramoyl-tripeptide--D-alanyl-D-alanine ligase